jgi:type I restriction enzyme S subunit
MYVLQKTLGEICDEVNGVIRTGPFGSQLHESDYSKEGNPVVMPKNIIDGRINTDDVARISSEHVERLSKHVLNIGDIVYGRRGDIGRRAIITEKESGFLCGTGCLKISLGDQILDSYFLYYYLGQQKVIGWIYNQAIGATMPNLNTSILRSVPIAFPEIKTQIKIANILKTFDDLIENNTRRIAILEEMAQMIYREWFVEFRFPGYEKVKMTDSPLGKIPEGWEVRRLRDLVDFQRGVEPGSKNYHERSGNGYVPFLRVGDLGKRGSSIFIKKSFAKGRLLSTRDIAITMDGTVGLVRMGLEGAYSSGIRKIVPLKDCPLGRAYIYQLLKSEHIQAIIEAHARGTTIKHASSSIDYMTISLPPNPLISFFEKSVDLMMDLSLSLSKRNQALRQTRDLLLPKLISGEVDVSDLGIEVAEIEEPESVSLLQTSSVEEKE